MKKNCLFVILFTFLSLLHSEDIIQRKLGDKTFTLSYNKDENHYYVTNSNTTGTLYVKEGCNDSVTYEEVILTVGQAKTWYTVEKGNNSYIVKHGVSSSGSTSNGTTHFTLYIVYDGDKPSCSISGYINDTLVDINNSNKWYNQDVLIKLSELQDKTTSIDYSRSMIENTSIEQIAKDVGINIFNNSELNLFLQSPYKKITSSTPVEIQLCDKVGNYSELMKVYINIDKKEPLISVKDESGKTITTGKDNWYRGNTINLYDNNKESETQFYLGTDRNGVVITNPMYISNGKYTIFAEDAAGNNSQCELSIDYELPSISCNTLKFEKDENQIISSIKYSFDKKDDYSGINDFKISYNGDKNFDRSKTNTITISAYASDKAGNETYFDWKKNGYSNYDFDDKKLKITLPPYISLKECDIGISDNNSFVELTLTNCNEDFLKKTNKIELVRKFYVPSSTGNSNGKEYIELNESNFTTFFNESMRNNWKELTVPKKISSEDIYTIQGNYFLKDFIPVSSGFGHLVTGYTLLWETKDLPTQEESSEVYVAPMSNKPAIIHLRIKGKTVEGNEEAQYLYIDIENNKVKYTQNDKFEIPSNGCIYLEYKIDNPDCEPYELELREMVKLPDEDMFISIGLEGFIHIGAMKECKTYTYADNQIIFDGEKWNTFENPLYLDFNRPTNLQIYTKEGFLYKHQTGKTYGQVGYTSEVIKLQAVAPDLGGFKLMVGDDAGYNDKGITAKPFQEVKISISSDNIKNVVWDFGDENTSTELEVSHMWSQLDSREADTSNYLLKITYGTIEKQIPVFIVDTQYGKLYGDEIWRGKHKILSTIKVGSGQILTIGDYTNKETEILCIGDLTEDYKGEIFIDENAELVVNNGKKVKFVESRNDSAGYVAQKELIYGWKGIRCKGTLSIENAEFLYSDRAITVLDGGIGKINNCDFISNKIGLHLLRGSKFTSDNILMENNRQYGIKQEKGSNLSLQRYIFKSNIIDWYDPDDTELSEEEIEQKIEE